MKKIAAVFTFALFSVSPGIAAAECQSCQQGGDLTPRQTQEAESTVEGSAVQNQNQLQIKNQSEETQVKTAVQEQEAQQTQEEVGFFNVQQILVQPAQSALQAQAQQTVREQIQVQEQVQSQVQQIKARPGFVKFLFGPDYKAIKTARRQLEQNQLQVMNLQRMQTKTQNQGDEVMLQNSIQATQQVNTTLQQQLQAQEKSFSLFGWLFRLL